MDPKGNGNGSNAYEVKKPVTPQRSAIIIGWIVVIAVFIAFGYGTYRVGKAIYQKGKDDLKTEFVQQLASSQDGKVDEFGFAHVSGGQVMILYNFKPFSDTKLKK
jgi:hypothetical protein